MKRRLLFLLFLVASLDAASVGAASREVRGDDLCAWMSVSVVKHVGDRWEFGGSLEGRANENLSSQDQWFLRQIAGYAPCKWLKIRYQTDFIWASSGFRVRFMPDVTGKWRRNGFSCSMRLRFASTCQVADGTFSNVVRAKATFAYNIKEVSIEPLLAVEPYFWDGINRWRYYAGFNWNIDGRNSLTLQYIRQDFTMRGYDDNVIFLKWKVDIK